MIFRYLNMFLIRQIGYHYESQLIKVIMQSIFYSQFFITAILLLLCNANFSSYRLLSWLPLKGSFSDTTNNWYILIGPAIIKTMVVLAVFPQINFGGFYLIRVLRRFRDSGITCNRTKNKKTKLTSVSQYVELYSG